MSDLSELQSAGIVKVIGSSSTGVEQTPVTSTNNGDLTVADLCNNGGVQGAIVVGNVAIQAMVGVSPLSNRKKLTIYNNSGATIYWGYNNTVTTLTGTPMLKDQSISLNIGSNVSVYLIAASGSNNVRITECA